LGRWAQNDNIGDRRRGRLDWQTPLMNAREELRLQLEQYSRRLVARLIEILETEQAKSTIKPNTDGSNRAYD